MPGHVVWIGLRPARRRPPVVVREVTAIAGRGLVGDRAEVRPSRVRQVTLIDAAAVARMSERLGRGAIDPALLRRNVVVAGVDLEAARGGQLRVGEVLLRVTGPCDPCARMEEALGAGGFEVMRNLGGLTAVVLIGGALGLGSPVTVEPDPGTH
jgi:MOSC domain-containing protein YiiM